MYFSKFPLQGQNKWLFGHLKLTTKTAQVFIRIDRFEPEIKSRSGPDYFHLIPWVVR